MARGRSIIEKIWEQLDEDTAKLLAAKAQMDVAEELATIKELEAQILTQRGRCRGKAEALAVLMHPHYPNVEAIAQETMARHMAALEGRSHTSPGLLFEMDHGVITRLQNAQLVSVVPS